MKYFDSPYKQLSRKINTWCNYTQRLDTYGCGCQHDCKYCYAKGLLAFRGHWNSNEPAIANIKTIRKAINQLTVSDVIRIGGMTDCFQPIEKTHKLTLATIKLLNNHKINYLIVTKSDMVASDEYLNVYDKKLAHFQVTITSTSVNDYENAPPPQKRIDAIERLYNCGFDVSVRLSPFIPQNIDLTILNKIKCNKILIEFLKINHWIRKQFDIDYSEYSLRFGGHDNLQLERKIEYLKGVQSFSQKSVGEYVYEHHKYFSNNYNYNKNDCCNLTLNLSPEPQLKLAL
ncbi:MAG: hypothetical protein M0P71_13115 [Melioribacteraceae bacterium]|jgi:DNA repair photolyase|nr:hypothetical protein [Melioribacteraceae bacterium]